ncbi:MAG: hypothetical protein ACRDGV_10315 [Candidatus Limnocylindria bacterium]
MHLNWLSHGRTADPGAAGGVAEPGAEPFELSVIDLVLIGGRRLAWIATNGRRTSDWLNMSDTLQLRGAQSVDLTDATAAPPPLPTDVAEEPLAASDVLFAIPPPLPANRHLRLHRRRVHVQLVLPGFRIGGQAHVRPGAEVGTHLFRSGRRFVPLTDVELVSTGEPGFSWTAPVLIVNAMHVKEMSGPAPVQPPGSEGAVAAAQAAEATGAADAMNAGAAEDEDVPAEAMGSRTAILLTCLELLLNEGVIDITEFQEKRASLPQD